MRDVSFLNAAAPICNLTERGYLALNAVKMSRVIDREKNIVRIKWVSDESLDLAVPSPFYADTRSLAQAIRKTREGSSLLESISKAADVQSGIITQMRELESQSASEITDTTDQAGEKLNFSYLLEELAGTQKMLSSSIKTLNVITENLRAADSNVEKKILEQIITLTRNKLDHSESISK